MTISVKICTGTCCYVMGGASLLSIEDELTEQEKEQVEVIGSSCLGLCKKYNSNVPFAKINDEIIENASLEKLAQIIKETISQSK